MKCCGLLTLTLSLLLINGIYCGTFLNKLRPFMEPGHEKMKEKPTGDKSEALRQSEAEVEGEGEAEDEDEDEGESEGRSTPELVAGGAQRTLPEEVQASTAATASDASSKRSPVFFRAVTRAATASELECEFPPLAQEDLTRMRRKRLATDTLVCLEDYPYTASVRVAEEHRCGGAIVSRLWVITAAECFDYVMTEEVTLRIRSVFRDFGGRLLSASRIRTHPQYRVDQLSPMHNLALVKVNVPIVFGARSQPVRLPAHNASLPAAGETVVTGYGAVSNKHIATGLEQELRKMQVTALRKAECRKLYGADYHLQYDHVCLQSAQGAALCEGDIGDPAVHFDGADSRGTLHAVAVFAGGSETCHNQSYGVYSLLAPSRRWIDEVLADNDSDSANSEQQAKSD